MGKEQENPFGGFKVLTDSIMPDVETVDPSEMENKENSDIPVSQIEEKRSDQDMGIREVEVLPGTEEKDEDIDFEEPKDDGDQKEEGKAKEYSEDDDSEDESNIQIFANYLNDKGIIEIDENFEDSEEGLEKAITDQIDRGISNYKDSLGDMSQKFIKYIEDGGDPTNFIKSYSAPDYSAITEDQIEDEGLQKKLVSELLAIEGYSPEEIREKTADYEDGGILEKEARRAKNKLIRHSDARKAEMLKQQEEARIQQEKAHDEFIDNLEKDINKRTEIAGFEIKEKEKKKLFEYITKVDRKTGKTQMMLDMENDPDANLKMAFLLHNKFDLSKVIKKAEKEVASRVKSGLNNSLKGEGNKRKSKSKTMVTDERNGNPDFRSFGKAIM